MKKKGSAILIVVIIIMVVFILAAYMVDISIKSNRVASDTLNRTREYYSAETGIYDSIKEINEKIDNKEPAEDSNMDGEISGTIEYKDVVEDYKAEFKLKEKSDDLKKYTFKIRASGNYNSQGCGVVSEITLYYDIDNDNNKCKYLYYTINNWKVYKAMDI
ncbi:hypothetical protein [Clostridium sp. BJN0013]|uniref:hypothetical protein n=1 Tax=Clostridium sp. BJN0013 TaxID=3236840 RepID=UPI0034C6ACBF